MSINYNLKLLVVFFVAASLASLAGPMSNGFNLPVVQLAHANIQPCIVHGVSGACSEPWYPAGPAMNALSNIIFTDPIAEYVNLQSLGPSIDFTDSPCTPAACGSILGSPNFLVTAPIAEQGYYEIQYMMANNFWGCQFSFGNSACGVQIRQGIAHMMDKASFVANDPSIAGVAEAIDNPVPTSSVGGLPSPNPCNYDASFPQSGSNCVVGAPGGTAYLRATATGAAGFPWLQAPGSPDLNAAAQHFVNAGIATGFNPTTSVLTGISPTAATNAINIFIRSDDPARNDLGKSLQAQICYLFTGSYTAPCMYLFTTSGPNSAFPGFTTSKTAINLNWWMYTAAFSGQTFFDTSLYYTYNSRFVSGIPSIQPPNGPCSPLAVSTNSASNYMYLCSPTYDSFSTQMETAPCLTAPGDPLPGQTSNGPPADCPGTSQLSAISAGIQAEATFGANAFTMPIFERTDQFGYLNGWTRAINDAGVGLPNYFTWLDAYNPGPQQPGTIRQGFSQTVRSVSPYIASTPWDTYLVSSVYDPLYKDNPLNHGQGINWMTESTSAPLSNSSLTYTPPPHTLTTYRFTLRPDLFFQDGRQVTSYDVAFSYLSLIGSGSYLGSSATAVTGITILGRTQFDIGVGSVGPFVLQTLTNLPIVPARYWTGAGSSAWDTAMAACAGSIRCPIAQYALDGSTVICPSNSGQPGCASPSPSATLMQADPAKTSATYDPIASHSFVGSGPWECGIVTSSGSGTCSSNGIMTAPIGGFYTLTRFGNGLAPASSISGIYFRSSGNLALYIWSQQNDMSPVLAFVSVSSCYQQPVSLSGPCGHWQQGMGNPGAGTPVGVSQVAISDRFWNLNWLSPSEWATTPPTGIGSFPPVLYEGSTILTPAPSSSSCTVPNNYYDC